jgi:hypothetical protein
MCRSVKTVRWFVCIFDQFVILGDLLRSTISPTFWISGEGLQACDDWGVSPAIVVSAVARYRSLR